MPQIFAYRKKACRREAYCVDDCSSVGFDFPDLAGHVGEACLDLIEIRASTIVIFGSVVSRICWVSLLGT